MRKKFYADCQSAGEAVVQRSGLPDKAKYQFCELSYI